MLRSCVTCLLLAATWIAACEPALARVRVEAYAGQPFGVGKVTFDVRRDEPSIPLADERFTVQTADGRVLYPVLKAAPVKKLLRQILEIETPLSVTVYFLYQGDEPLVLNVYSPTGRTARVTPRSDARGHRRLMEEWWTSYRQRWQDLRRSAEFPPVVHNFTTATLARRLGKELPAPSRTLLSWADPQLTAWDAILTSEAYQLDFDRRLLLDRSAEPSAPASLPSAMPWPKLDIDVAELADVQVEPIAGHVPAECFYIRYGTFSNYLWFRDLNKKWQGDLANMVQRRGIDRAASKRIEQQLSLRQSALAKVLGPQVIEDVALIGLDPYVSSGAAVGILFQAKNNFLLGRDLTGQRQEALKTFSDAEESTVSIAGRDVSLIANPGRNVRSYYAVDGDFHFVTTSARLMERFLEAGQGERSLAKSPGFLLARKRLPVDRSDTIFAHIPSEFFRSLCSPAVWIENHRRLRSQREMKLLPMARWAAMAENGDELTVEELIAADLLPPGFGSRPDESSIVENDEGLSDSLRGHPGRFIPIADQQIESITEADAQQYRRFSDRFLQEVGRVPPITIAAQRLPREGGETMAARILIEPAEGFKMGKFAESLGPSSQERILPVEGDLAHFELVLERRFALLAPDDDPHHLFGALRDFLSPLVVNKDDLAPARATELVRGYLGAWPRPGILALLTGSNPLLEPEPQPLENNMFLAGRDDLMLLSFKPDVIAEVLPQLTRQQADRPAHVRLSIQDLTGTELSKLVDAFGYSRARETSVSGSRFMNSLANQLHVPRPLCQEVAEEIIDGKLVCALGGEYALVEPASGLPVWVSTALSDDNRFLLSEVPEDYRLPLLGWFRGLRGDAEVGDDAVTAHLEIDMDKSGVPWSMEIQPAVPPAADDLAEPAPGKGEP